METSIHVNCTGQTLALVLLLESVGVLTGPDPTRTCCTAPDKTLLKQNGDLNDFTQIAHRIEQKQNCLTEFSLDSFVSVFVSSPNVSDMLIVDLPGIQQGVPLTSRCQISTHGSLQVLLKGMRRPGT